MAPNKSRPRLWQWQIADLENIGNAYERHQSVCYQAPTGSGKTVIGAEFIARQPDDRIFVVGHRDEICQQFSAALARLEIEHGIIAPGYKPTSHRVQVASVMTLVRRLDQFTPPPTLLVYDEAHHAAAPTWRKITAAFPDADILGLTATPRRLDGKPLDDIFDKLICGPSIAWLIDQGFLAPVTVFAPAHSPDLKAIKIRAGDYAPEQLAGVMSDGMIVGGAVDEYEKLCSGARAIVFCVDIAHSKLVAKAFRARGYRAEHVDGETSRAERRDLIAALANGSIDILTNCGLISEGLDVPGAEVAILLRPTKSLALYLQMVGRALRTAPGKDCAFILDHAGNVFRHGLPAARRQWSLHGRQQDDSAGDRLFRCPACGAVNDRGALECVNCGAELHRHRPPRAVVEGGRLAEAIEVPVTDTDLREMTYRDLLKWAADQDGRLMVERLERIARARDFKPGWIYYNRDRPLDEALEAYAEYRRALREELTR
jgi:superfamily II DNA or RNA helicase